MKHKLFSVRVISLILLCITTASLVYFYTQQRVVISSPHQNQVEAAPPPELTEDPFALGEYYFNQPPHNTGVYDLTKARQNYERSILQAIQSGESIPKYAWYNLARIDFVEANLDRAITKLHQQQEVHGEAVPQTHYMLGLAYGYRALETESEEDWARAEAGFLKYMEYAPDSPWPRVDLAWVYFGQGKFAEMIPMLEEGLVKNNDHAWLLNTYGLALLNSGDRAGALDAFTKAQQAYSKLTVEDWANAYKENDPRYWNRNFKLFGATIDYNLELAKDQ